MTEAGSLTAMDIIVLLLVGGGIVFGVVRGFVTQVLSLMAWVAAVMELRLFYTPASAWAAEATGTEAGEEVLAFAGLFFGEFIVFSGSEERRYGNAWISSGKSRGSPFYTKKKNNK